jgi:hypothetical protein
MTRKTTLVSQFVSSMCSRNYRQVKKCAHSIADMIHSLSYFLQIINIEDKRLLQSSSVFERRLFSDEYTIIWGMCIWRNDTFLIISRKPQDLGKTCMEHKLCVSLFSITARNICFAPINNKELKLDIRAETHVGLHIKYPLLLSVFNQNWNVPNKYSRPSHYQTS